MNQGPEQHVIDINGLHRDVLNKIVTYVGFKELATLTSLNNLWYNFVQEHCHSLIAQYFPYLVVQGNNEVKANAFNIFQAEYCRYKKQLFPQINMSFILEALGGSVENIAKIENKDDKISLCGLFMSNAHILPNELLEENKKEIIKKALLLAASNGQLLTMKDLLTRSEITPQDKAEALEHAAQCGQLEIVKHLSPLPEITSQHKWLALYFAAIKGYLEIVKHLSALPEITPHDKGEVLIATVKLGLFEVVKHLSTLSEITAENKGRALYWAALKDELVMVKHLLTLPEITSQDKGFALKGAVRRGFFVIAKHLLTLQEITLTDKVTALRQLTWKGRLIIAKHLLISIVQTAKDNCLTYPKRAVTFTQSILNSPFLRRHKTALRRLTLTTTMCLGLTAKFPLISAGLSIFLGYAAGVMLVSMLLSTLYQRYMARSFVNYNTPEKIQTITDVVEKQALKAGMDAKTWLGYAKSFTVYATYRQMSAFNAGKKCALNNASQTLEEITKLRVS